MSWGKHRKVQNFFHSNRKRSHTKDKDGKKSVAIISYKIKFIDSGRLMASSLSNLADNLMEEIHKSK